MIAWILRLLIEGLMIIAPTETIEQRNGPSPAQTKSALPHCPVMPEREVDPDIFLDWRGRRVFFCCEPCKQKFEETPEKFAAALARYQPAERDRLASTRRYEIANDREYGGPLSENQWDHSDPISRSTSWFGKLHPVTLHLPIGALFAGALAEFLYARRKKVIYDHAARYCLWFAMISGLVTATLGWCLGGFRWNDSNWILALHRWLGTATAILLVVLVISGERMNKRGGARFAYRFLLASTTLIIFAAGFFGGAMVWGIDHLSGGDFSRVAQCARSDDLPPIESR
ncbi:MAG: hypothetical protein HY287_06775 [Planctomycetes bacterium]|nr:hypothetical protein [Planctomycetota bacterium]